MSGVTTVVRDVHELTDPRSLPNLELWLDARYPNGIGSAMPFAGDPLSTWTDLSGKGRHLSQSNAAKRPLWLDYTNLLLNSSGETNTGWASNNGAYYPVEWDSTISRTGKQSRRGWSLNGDRRQILSIYAMGMDTYVRMPIKASTEYNLSAYFRPGQAGYQAQVALIQYRADGSLIFTDAGAVVDLPTNTWTRASAQITTHPETVLCFPMGIVQTSDGSLAPAGDFAHVDDAMMVEGDVLYPYASSPDLPNSQPVVQFDGVDDILSTPTLTIPGNDFTFYSVFRNRATQNQRILSTKNNGERAMLMSSGSTFYAYGYPGAGQIGAPLLGTNTWMIGTNKFESPSYASAYMNGKYGSTGQDAAGYILNTPISVGGTTDNNSLYMNGDMVCSMVFSEAHSDATRNKVERMLSRRYGVAVE